MLILSHQITNFILYIKNGLMPGKDVLYMKTKQILTAGAIALSMILTGCSSTSTDTKDTKTTEVAKKMK